jgi:hypothetical protein
MVTVWYSNIVSFIMFWLWLIAIILVYKREKNKTKRNRFLLMAIPIWLSVAVEGICIYLMVKYFSVKTFLSWSLPPGEGKGPPTGSLIILVILLFVHGTG